jgi:acetyl esterase
MTLDPVLADVLAARPTVDAGGLSVTALRALDAQRRRQVEAARKLPVGAVVEGTAAGVRVRIYRPEGAGPHPTLLFLHGGGWVVGGIARADPIARLLCRLMPAVVVSGSYRLAPEHPFPAAYRDAVALASWTVSHVSRLGGDARRVGLSGESAGGNLAAAAALASRRWDGPRMAAQLLINPATDLGPDDDPTPSWLADEDPATPSEYVRFSMRTYLGGAAADDWRASPARATDLSGAPAALVVTAHHDCLRDDGARYADLLSRAGVPAEVVDYPGLVHGFTGLAGTVPHADAAVRDYVTRFRDVLDAQASR